jgi:hypothetical protein
MDRSPETTSSTVAPDSPKLEPQTKIVPFNWQKLDDEFEEELREQSEEEENLFKEFSRLVEVWTELSTETIIQLLTSLQYFTVWANTTHSAEAERATKRYDYLTGRQCAIY